MSEFHHVTELALMSAGSSNSAARDVISLVMSVLKQIRPAANVLPDSRLADAGYSSLDMVNIMLGIEAAFDVMIPQEDISPENFTSAASIAEMILRLTSEK